MAEKLNVKRVAFSLAIVAGILSIVCALFILIAPSFSINLFGAIFHGIDLSKVVSPISLGKAILGTVEVVVIALIAGWLFASIYNKLR